MASRQSQLCIEERKRRSESRELPEAHHRMPDGKLIATVQICLQCGRTLPFKQGRKSCPYCQGLLRIRTMVLKAH